MTRISKQGGALQTAEKAKPIKIHGLWYCISIIYQRRIYFRILHHIVEIYPQHRHTAPELKIFWKAHTSVKKYVYVHCHSGCSNCRMICVKMRAGVSSNFLNKFWIMGLWIQNFGTSGSILITSDPCGSMGSMRIQNFGSTGPINKAAYCFRIRQSARTHWACCII